jgi:hypothetical protein
MTVGLGKADIRVGALAIGLATVRVGGDVNGLGWAVQSNERADRVGRREHTEYIVRSLLFKSGDVGRRGGRWVVEDSRQPLYISPRRHFSGC